MVWLHSIGQAIFNLKSNFVAACIQDEAILFPSPLHATVFPLIGPRCSSKVITSAISWHGWELSVKPLMTGTEEYSAISRILSSPNVLIIIPSTYRDSTRAVSAVLSLESLTRRHLV